ncbi:MAG: gamma-glutamyltransferase family protein [Spirochaetaceae bacterium]|nr:gamma-glutamyltransferase family protein [Spirochaetaceae bacterium]
MRVTSSVHYISRRSPVLSRRGMVASSSPQASLFGLQMLSAGGTAADAAVAAAAGLQVTMPCQTGLGGDCFVLYYEAATGTVHALNGSGRSAGQLSLELLARQGLGGALPVDHAHNVTVPGAPAAWEDVQRRFGTLPRERVVAPAAALAEEGYPVAPLTAALWEGGAAPLMSARHGGELLLNGRAPRAGEVMRIATLAATLRTWGESGAAPFYTGAIAERVVAEVGAAGGMLAPADLAAHRSAWVQPLSVDYRGRRIWECPPNGQGLAVLVALRLLAQFDLAAEHGAHAGADRYHLAIECMRRGFAAAARCVADPEHAELPIRQLLSRDYAAAVARHIDPRRASAPPPGGEEPVAPGDTVYLCTADAAGNACSFIGSNYMSFGTGIVPEGCGYALQNRGAGFVLEPGHANSLAPGKRPYHTIIPGMMTNSDGGLQAAFGVMGGFMQPQGHLQVVSALLDDGVDPQAALDRPRFQLAAGSVAALSGAAVRLEEGLEAVADQLRDRGHRVQLAAGDARLGFGRGQAIWRTGEGVLWGGSDPRGDGCALGLPG